MTQLLDKTKEPWLRIFVDGKLERGYRGEGSISKTIEELIYQGYGTDDNSVIEFFIDDVKYELPNFKQYYFWGVYEDAGELQECIEDWVDFHKAFYYFEKKEKHIPVQNNC